MKKQHFSARMVLSSVMLAGMVVPMMTATVSAAPRPLNKLEIWPGQRVVMILPITTGTDFSGGPELGRAIVPVLQQPLQNALARTGKFSVVAPYRFDPVIRRAVYEKALSDDDVRGLLETPSLENAQNVLGKIKFDQPSMVLETKIEDLVVGGTQKAPTVQLQVTGRLYEVGGSEPPKSITVRSRSYTGATPEIRLQSAATQAFQDIAASFIEPPASFQLPAPLAPVGPGKNPVNAVQPVGVQPVAPVVVPPTNVTVKPPSSLSPAAGQSFVPELPAAQPPLNIAVGEAGAGVR